jgi:hypothetical protein
MCADGSGYRVGKKSLSGVLIWSAGRDGGMEAGMGNQEVKRDPNEVMEMECECGEKIKGARKKLYYLYKLHQADHAELSGVQWAEAAKKIEKLQEAGKV